MKIEMDDQTEFTVCFVALLLIITLSFLGGCHITEATRQKAFSEGLVEKNDTAISTHWEKP